MKQNENLMSMSMLSYITVIAHYDQGSTIDVNHVRTYT